MNVIFSAIAWEQYTEWTETDKGTVKKINALIKDISRNSLSKGIGQPEPLKYRKAWSRRITRADRLVYNFDENKNLIVFSCLGHYEE